MKYPDSQVPATAIQSAARWRRGDSRFQPKIQRPRNVDSRKNAARPSTASGAPKTLPDESRVHRPVHPELELLHEPGRDADREVDQEERPEETSQPQPIVVPAPVPQRLEDRHDRAEPERERHEQEVVERGGRELAACQVDPRRGEDQVHSSPHSAVNEAPGSSAISDSPLRKAFGGQVIGSTAMLRRATSGSASPLKTMT